MSNLLNNFIRLQNEQAHENLKTARAADPRFDGPNGRFMGRIEFDGQTHYYDSRTQVCERRHGSKNIPSGRRAGWIVSKAFNGNGYNGMYARYDAYVIRPKSKAELLRDAEAREMRKAKVSAKRALPWAVRMVMAKSGYNRKGVLRCHLWHSMGGSWRDYSTLAAKVLPGFVYAPTRINSRGEVVDASSCYGPRTRRILERMGVPVEKHNEVLTVCGFTF